MFNIVWLKPHTFLRKTIFEYVVKCVCHNFLVLFQLAVVREIL